MMMDVFLFVAVFGDFGISCVHTGPDRSLLAQGIVTESWLGRIRGSRRWNAIQTNEERTRVMTGEKQEKYDSGA